MIKREKLRNMELKNGDQFWCWWLSRYLIFVGRLPNGDYEFEDFGDDRFFFNEKDVTKLERRTE